MVYLILSILSSISVGVFLKILKKGKTDIFQIIIFNYITTVLFSYLIFNPKIETLPDFPIITVSSLGILLPTIFIIQYLSIKKTGIIKTDIAQRMSLFIPILAAIYIFKEDISDLKYLALFIGFLSIGLILKRQDISNTKDNKYSFIYLLFVFLGFGVIDICFKQVALYSIVPYTSTLFYIFSISLLLSLVFYLLFLFYKKEKLRITIYTIYYGFIIGSLNFMNIYFYLNAHKAFASNPTIVFAGMNYGVIFLGTLIGYFYFKEKLSRLNLLGLGLAVVSITLLIWSQIMT